MIFHAGIKIKTCSAEAVAHDPTIIYKPMKIATVVFDVMSAGKNQKIFSDQQYIKLYLQQFNNC